MKHKINHYPYSSFNNDSLVLYKKHEPELTSYTNQLLWWNERLNLVSRDVSRETLKQHIIHSLLISFSKLYQGAEIIIDAGSGGGLPGIPLSIIDKEKKVVLNDIVSKKMMACRQMILKLGLKNCSVEAKSIGQVEVPKGSIIVSKHAFKVSDLIEFLSGKSWHGIILLKGLKEVENELSGIEAGLKIDVFSLERESNSFYDGKALVEITR